MIDLFFLVCVILLLAFFTYDRGLPVIGTICGGFKEGAQLLRRTLPTIAGYVIAFTLFKAAGGMDWLLDCMPMGASQSNFVDLLSMALARPFSGSLTTGLFSGLLQAHPDPLVVTQAAVMIGSTETTFYVVSVYFAAVGIRKTRYAVPLGLLLDGLGFVLSFYICRWLFQLSWLPIIGYS